MTVDAFSPSDLRDLARHHYERDGWFPVPGTAGKRPALSTYSEWKRLARRGERPPWEEVERTFFAGPRVQRLGHLLVATFCAVDVDGREGEAVLAAGPVDEGPEVLTRHGRHLYFRGAKSLPYFRDLGPDIHLLGPGHYAELPPTGGKEWRRHVEGELPRLPRHLRLLLRTERKATATAEPAPVDTAAELAAWRVLLPDLAGAGPWRARCPLHDDERPSFSVFAGQRDGRLLGRCHAGCGLWTPNRLRRRLRHRLTGQYDRAREAVEALGDSLDTPARDALGWLIDQAERHSLVLADPEGVGASYRQLAAATGLETVDGDGRLSNRGRSIARLLRSLEAVGVGVIRGKAWTPARRSGVATRLVIPEAWAATRPADEEAR